MKILTIAGVVLSTITLISMSVVGVNAYNYEQDRVRLTLDKHQRECLALNIYHEAKGESELGQRAVAYVTLNRANDPDYPNSICGVVYQGVKKNGIPLKNQCQFSWFCDGKDDFPQDKKAYDEAVYVASVVMNTYGMSFDPTMGATMYHSDSVKPSWRKAFVETTTIENHIFYRKE